MTWPPERDRFPPDRTTARAILLPLVLAPIAWIGLIHLGTRIMWFLGF